MPLAFTDNFEHNIRLLYEEDPHDKRWKRQQKIAMALEEARKHGARMKKKMKKTHEEEKHEKSHKRAGVMMEMEHE